MRKLLWSTDIHLDFLEDIGPVAVSDNFVRPLSEVECDGFLLSGDISNSSYLLGHLTLLDTFLKSPIYFVLGNHDFYGGNFGDTRRDVRALCSKSKRLRYLSNAGVVEISKKTALVGHDGWYDAYYGSPDSSPYVMSDWFRIEDFVSAGASTQLEPGKLGINASRAVSVARKAAAEASSYVEKNAREAAESYENVLVITHVPPFPVLSESTRKTTDALPWYTSRLMGDALKRVASRFPNVRFDVFCGHVHDAVSLKIQDNLFCRVGPSDYGNPNVAGQIIVP